MTARRQVPTLRQRLYVLSTCVVAIAVVAMHGVIDPGSGVATPVPTGHHESGHVGDGSTGPGHHGGSALHHFTTAPCASAVACDGDPPPTEAVAVGPAPARAAGRAASRSDRPEPPVPRVMA